MISTVVLRKLLATLSVIFVSGCAYKLSNKVDSLPGGAKVLFVPVFKNISTEPLIEAYFTEALRSEILRSGYAQLANGEPGADAVLIGTVRTVEVTTDELVVKSKDSSYLPVDTVLSLKAKVKVEVDLVLKRKGSSEVLWQSSYGQTMDYTPPQLTLPTINSANNLYNLSARKQTFQTLSKEMMHLAFDRMVDTF
jgi:hypothetical protein